MYLSHSQRCRLAPKLPDIFWIAASVRWALKRVHASASNEPRLKCAARVSVWSRLCSFRAAVLRLQWYCVISFFNFVLSVFCHDDLRLPPLPLPPPPNALREAVGTFGDCCCCCWRKHDFFLVLFICQCWNGNKTIQHHCGADARVIRSKKRWLYFSGLCSS